MSILSKKLNELEKRLDKLKKEIEKNAKDKNYQKSVLSGYHAGAFAALTEFSIFLISIKHILEDK